MFGSATSIIILTAMVISLHELNVNCESVEIGSGNSESPQQNTDMPEELAFHSTENYSKNTIVLPSLDSRYGVEAPSVALIDCGQNAEYAEGSCKEISPL